MLWASSQYGLIDMPFMTPGNLCNPSVRAGWRGAGSTSFGRASVDVQRQRTYRYQCRVGNPVHITQGNADQVTTPLLLSGWSTVVKGECCTLISKHQRLLHAGVATVATQQRGTCSVQDSGKDELPGSSGPPRPPRKQPPDQQDGPLDRLLEWIMPRERVRWLADCTCIA